jgi:putative Mg2+ transporter-C (MgtC) family protein
MAAHTFGRRGRRRSCQMVLLPSTPEPRPINPCGVILRRHASPVGIDQAQIDFLVRLTVAAAMGMAIGIEREMREHSAGLRTHMLVALGACLFTLVSAYGFQGVEGGKLGLPEPTRVASNIVTGVGFLGAGSILREGLSVRGLTTAATMWIVAAVGMAVGLGMFWASGVTVVITLASLLLLRPLRRKLHEIGEEEEEED